jgi:glucan biosynthesis protein C
MDSMRSVLMMLGVVIHSAGIYATDQPWAVSDPSGSIFFDGLGWFLHLFRMPAFFVISGFFVHFTLKRRPVAYFLRVRLGRILVPLVATGLTLATLQTYLLYHGVWLGLSAFLTQELPRSWAKGYWVMHLWFLINLALYFLAAIGVHVAARRLRLPPLPRLPRPSHPVLATAPLILGASIYALAVAAFGKLFPAVINEYLFSLVEIDKLLEYACFFVFGIALYENPALQRAFLKLNPAHWLLLAAAIPVYAVTKDSTALIPKAIELYAYTVMVWVSVAFCFNFFIKFCNDTSKVFEYLSEASYTVYLFHHVIVIAFGMLLLPVAWPAGVKFLLIVSATLALTVAIHHFLILRFNALRFLFNGKTVIPRPATILVPAAGLNPEPPQPVTEKG